MDLCINVSVLEIHVLVALIIKKPCISETNQHHTVCVAGLLRSTVTYVAQCFDDLAFFVFVGTTRTLLCCLRGSAKLSIHNREFECGVLFVHRSTK